MDALARALPQGPPQRIYRPDVRGGMWFRPQAGLMLSEEDWIIECSTRDSGYTTDNSNFWALPHDYRLFLVDVDVAMYVGAAATWVIGLYLWNADNSNTLLFEHSTAGQTGNRWYGGVTALNRVVDPTLGNSGSNPQGLWLSIDEQSGSTTCYPTIYLRYRLIAP